MKKLTKMLLILTVFLSLSGCEKGYFGLAGVLLSPARDLTGFWDGTLTSSWNNVNNTNQETQRMTLDITQEENDIVGTMTWGSYSGNFTGYVEGVHIYFTCIIGNGCIDVHGTFTSTNMEGMRNSDPPPYLTCYDALNDGWGSKGIEWHLVKE
jgi:hypothetical protein